ncbi:MAG: type II secretion system protein M [Planctomycetes bacterium]|nr:type II secretion system protein M [Planctomycetota bacterium]
MRRRWYQFSLRSILILTTICAVLSALAGWWAHRSNRERQIVAILHQKPGLFIILGHHGLDTWAGVTYFNEVELVIAIRPIEAYELQALARLPRLRNVVISHVNSTEPYLNNLRRTLPHCMIDVRK